MKKQEKESPNSKDLQISISMTENGKIMCQIMDMDEPMENKKYAYDSIDQALAKVREALTDEKKEEAEEVPSSKEDVKKMINTKNIGSTAKEMKSKGY